MDIAIAAISTLAKSAPDVPLSSLD